MRIDLTHIMKLVGITYVLDLVGNARGYYLWIKVYRSTDSTSVGITDAQITYEFFFVGIRG